MPAGGRSMRYLAGRYLALTAGAFFRAATHCGPLRSAVVFPAFTAPPAAMARATAAIVTSSAACTSLDTGEEDGLVVLPIHPQASSPCESQLDRSSREPEAA